VCSLFQLLDIHLSTPYPFQFRSRSSSHVYTQTLTHVHRQIHTNRSRHAISRNKHEKQQKLPGRPGSGVVKAEIIIQNLRKTRLRRLAH
jgi:hypothetical protein